MKVNELLQKKINNPENKGDEFGFTNQANPNTKKIINKDGSFNLIRVGERKSLFHSLITMSWMLKVFTRKVPTMQVKSPGMQNLSCLIIFGKTVSLFLSLIK